MSTCSDGNADHYDQAPGPDHRHFTEHTVKLATFAATGDVLVEDGRVVRHRWTMPVADGTDGTHQWYDDGQTITVVDHINQWHIP